MSNAIERGVSMRAAQARSRLRAFARDAHGAASIELAIGAVVLVALSALCFDLYTRVRADTAGLRMAVTMADYLSREVAPGRDNLTALGTFLHEHELGVPADVVYMLTAIRQPPGDPAPELELVWDEHIQIGDATVTRDLAQDCTRYLVGETNEGIPESFKSGMAPGEVVIIAEVCARLQREGSLTGRFVAGDIYSSHAVPARDPNAPPFGPA